MKETESQKEKKEKAEQQAAIILMIANYVPFLDIEFLKAAAEEARAQAGLQESMAVLYPSHPQAKNDLLYLQASALEKLCDYIISLKIIDAKKKEIVGINDMFSNIQKLFVG